MPISKGIIAGIAAGIIMAIVSELGYRLGLCKSSLLVVDGSFVAARMKQSITGNTIYIFGIPVHIVTSAAFGAFYILATHILRLNPYSTLVLSVYLCVLWLSMLFVALPIAGQGILGHNTGRTTWIEQLALHIVFGLAFWWVL